MLVIIGLIVGGVLVGRDLISAAQVRAQISQIEKYNTAVTTFYTKYQSIPGDMNIATAYQFGFTIGSGCTGAAGMRDGNGLIDGQSGLGSLKSFGGETALFWMDLTTPGLTSMIEGQFPNGGATAGCTGLPANLTSSQIGEYVPAGKIGRGTYVVVGETSGANYYVLQGITGVNFNGNINNFTTPIPALEAYKIDQKMDDGLPTSGNVQAWYIQLGEFYAAPNAVTANSTTCYDTTTNNYSLTINGGAGVNCALSFQFQ